MKGFHRRGPLVEVIALIDAVPPKPGNRESHKERAEVT